MAAQAEDEDGKGHGPRPLGPWPLARRVHQQFLLVAVILLWGLAAFSCLFMSHTAAPATLPAAEVPASSLYAESALIAAQPIGLEPTKNVDPDPHRLDPERNLHELPRLLRRSASGLSDAQLAEYAVALRTALDGMPRLASGAPANSLAAHEVGGFGLPRGGDPFATGRALAMARRGGDRDPAAERSGEPRAVAAASYPSTVSYSRERSAVDTEEGE